MLKTVFFDNGSFKLVYLRIKKSFVMVDLKDGKSYSLPQESASIFFLAFLMLDGISCSQGELEWVVFGLLVQLFMEAKQPPSSMFQWMSGCSAEEIAAQEISKLQDLKSQGVEVKLNEGHGVDKCILKIRQFCRGSKFEIIC